MYSKFNLKLSDVFYNREVNKYLEVGRKIYNDTASSSRACLKKFIYDNGHIDGTALKQHWFQMENVDIFLSHSHKDLSKVKAFAGWLYATFGLTSFIDSCVWGYCDDLLKEIDEEFCKNKDSSTYSYELRNYTTSHVHMMLSVALSEMIDNTECIMFFNTPESVVLKEDLRTIREESISITLSPWIYQELAMTHMIGHKKLDRSEWFLEHAEKRNLAEYNSINVEYEVEEYLKTMIELDSTDLSLWEYKHKAFTHQLDGENISCITGHEYDHPLDTLYAIKKVLNG